MASEQELPGIVYLAIAVSYLRLARMEGKLEQRDKNHGPGLTPDGAGEAL